MIVSMLALTLGAAQAQDCDARGLQKQLDDIAPTRIPDLYVKLADCDAERAKKAAAGGFQRMLADREAVPAVVAAIRVGADADVRAWLDDQEPDNRSRIIGRLGGYCAETPAVGTFFVDAHAEIGDRFWDERWHRGLDACRVDAVQTLLAEALGSDTIGRASRNRSQFFSVLEVYARNLGADAIPTLEAYLAEFRDEEEAALLVNALADTTGLGSTDGANPEAVTAAKKVIVDAAPRLPERALERARATLNALGDEQAASALYQHALPDRRAEGTYTYGIALTADVTCKNGNRRGVLHLGTFTEEGHAWPDQLEPLALERAQQAWDVAGEDGKCKGEATWTLAMTDEPIESAEALEAWTTDVRKGFVRAFDGAQKATEETHPVFAW